MAQVGMARAVYPCPPSKTTSFLPSGAKPLENPVRDLAILGALAANTPEPSRATRLAHRTITSGALTAIFAGLALVGIATLFKRKKEE